MEFFPTSFKRTPRYPNAVSCGPWGLLRFSAESHAKDVAHGPLRAFEQPAANGRSEPRVTDAAACMNVSYRARAKTFDDPTDIFEAFAKDQILAFRP
jgi:hypothetical protein